MSKIYCWIFLFLISLSTVFSAEKIDIQRLFLFDKRGCEYDTVTEIKLSKHAGKFTCKIKKISAADNDFSSEFQIPPEKTVLIIKKILDADFNNMNNRYKGEKKTTADADGFLEIEYKIDNNIKKKRIDYSSPENCSEDFRKLFQILWTLKQSRLEDFQN